MNIKGPKGRGAYSAIVYKDGGMHVAEDNVGSIIKEATNAATVLQAAVDEGGRTELMGRFSIDDTINLPSAAQVQGVDFNTVITQTANKPIFSIIGTVGAMKSCSIKDIYLYGTNPATNTNQYGIQMKYTSNVVLNRVNFYDLYDGIHAETYFYVTRMYACNFDSQIEHNAMYLHADADWDANLIYLTDCYLASKGNNIDYTHLMGLLAKGDYFYSSGGYNIYGTRASGLNILQCDFDTAAENVIHETEYIEDSRFSDLWTTGSKKCFYLKDCYAITIDGGRLSTQHTGIDIDKGQKITIHGVNVIDCAYTPVATYPSIKLGTNFNVNDVAITGCVIGHSDNTYSIEEKAGNVHNVIVGNSLQKAGTFAAATEHAHNYSP